MTKEPLVKLTKAEFFKGLVGTRFIQAIFDKSLTEVRAAIQEASELPAIYTVETVSIHSTFVRTNGVSRRDTFGKNQYYREGDMFFHCNTYDSEQIIYLNM